MFDLCKEQEKILETNGHLLIIGGPGSGKTTISILKADKLVSTELQNEQKVMFLSFARATVARVIESINENSSIKLESKKYIDVDTYHSFFWRIIKVHGYLVGLPRKLSILTPPLEAVALSSIRNDFGKENDLTKKQKEEKTRLEKKEQLRLAHREGKICFDLFATFTNQLIESSSKIRELISSAFPVIIVDEFQDTNEEQWSFLKTLGLNTTLIVLADPEQRIFDFIGANPERINHFKEDFEHTEFDLSKYNFRSNGTDILKFGNDLIRGEIDDSYNEVKAVVFPSNQNQALAKLKIEVIRRRKKLIESNQENWSIAILVPSKKLMRMVSDAFRKKTKKLPTIYHKAAIDLEGAILAVELISFLLQPKLPKNDFREFINLLSNFYLGKGGQSPTKTDIDESIRIKKAYKKSVESRRIKGKIPKNSIINSILKTYTECRSFQFSGNPDNDWLLVRNRLEECDCKRLNELANEARNIRLLDRGTQLREGLSQDWRDNGVYLNALEIVKQSFIEEHFASSMKPETGIVVMNMHKAKGKQFDEVIIFEGWPRRRGRKIVTNPDRIIRGNVKSAGVQQAQYVLRVAATRAKKRTTIMTPKDDPCILFLDS